MYTYKIYVRNAFASIINRIVARSTRTLLERPSRRGSRHAEVASRSIRCRSNRNPHEVGTTFFHTATDRADGVLSDAFIALLVEPLDDGARAMPSRRGRLALAAHARHVDGLKIVSGNAVLQRRITPVRTCPPRRRSQRAPRPT